MPNTSVNQPVTVDSLHYYDYLGLDYYRDRYGKATTLF